MKHLRFLSLFALFASPFVSFSQFEYLIEDKFNLFGQASFNYNFWQPDESTNLEYYTEGLQNLKLEAQLTTGLSFLPELKAKWETNFKANHQEELLEAHSSASGIENAYNKLVFIAGFGKRILPGEFNPWISNSVFDLSYTKETFFISVSPTESNMRFAPFERSTTIPFSQGENLSMFTKFEEIRGTFKTGGIAIFPMLLTTLFGGDVEDIMDMDGFETRLGGYYSTFFKPYSTTQVVSAGNVSGGTNVIYNASFKSYGIVEEYTIPGEIFFLRMQFNLGVAVIELQKNSFLEDSSAPLFFHYRSLLEMGFHIPLAKNNLMLNLGGSFDWQFMFGGQYSDETENIETTSLINNDMIFKISGALSFNL